MLRTLFAAIVCCFLATTASAQSLKLGEKAPDWAGLKGTDGKSYALADFKEKDVLVIVFTCNSCPYSQDYEDRIIALCKEHCGEGKKAALVAINANKVKEDLPEEMAKRAKEKSFNYPYVWDETQETARAYDAKWTPEFYVFDRDRKLIYRGALDDHSDASKAKVNHVAAAVKASLAGETPKVQQTEAIGCAVRYERKRRPAK